MWTTTVNGQSLGWRTGIICDLLFGLYPLRFIFAARQSVYFPQGKSGNMLRGALGTTFRRIACVPRCMGPRHCERANDCPYARTFEPSALLQAQTRDPRISTPGGLSDWPRPFVFRATHLDGCRFDPGARFHFDLHLFNLESPALAYLVAAFGALAENGLGPRRGRVDLTGVWQLDEQRRQSAHVYDGSALRPAPLTPLELDLAPLEKPVKRVRVRFVTPTELKREGEIIGQPEFAVLASRIRDRISNLRALYGGEPLDLDFRAFREQAEKIQLTDYRLQHVRISRRSSRTGQTHPIGGFIGEAEYEGDLSGFVPYLRAAEWSGVGRQTVWGKGEIATEVLG